MADVKFAYGSSSSLTLTLASLASSSSLVAGRESTAVDNTTNKYLDVLLSGKITTGTSPTGNPGQITVFVYASYEDTPTYPDVLDGTDSDETFTSTGIRDAAVIPIAVISTDTTSNRTYWFGPRSVANCFGGAMPKYWGVWVAQSSGVALNSTGGNHAVWYTPVYETVA